jgi:hypothetical protein
MWTTCSIVDCSSKNSTTTDLPDFGTTITLSQSGMRNMKKKGNKIYCFIRRKAHFFCLICIFTESSIATSNGRRGR